MRPRAHTTADPAPAGSAWPGGRVPDLTRFFHPVLAARALGRRPRRILLGGHAYVLFRDRAGRPAALADACPHRLAPLSEGCVRSDGRLACPYHGWHFDAHGEGRSPSQPELKVRASFLQVREEHGYLWVAAPEVPAARLPQLGWEGYSFSGAFAMELRAPLHVALDNFSENEHTPWVHTRLGWDEPASGEVEFSCEVFDDRTEVHYAAPQRSSWLLPLLMLRPGDVYHNDWVTRFEPVWTEYTISWRDRHTGALRPFVQRAAIFMVPETATLTRFHVFLFIRVADPRFLPLLPLVRRAAMVLGWLEVRDDARFIPRVAGTPFEWRGMRLGRFDRPLVENHRLLLRRYLGAPDAGDPAGEG